MKQKGDNILFVGIDLGTSRSSICASNGAKEWIESYVGWPKDFISLKVVGRPVLFGSEALQEEKSEPSLLNPGASAFPVACCGVSERLESIVVPP